MIQVDTTSGSFIKSKSFTELQYFDALLGRIAYFSLILTGVLCVSLIPLYPILKSQEAGEIYSSTHQHQYAWVVSAAFLGGSYPAILISVVWSVVLSLLAYLLFLLERWRLEWKNKSALSSESVKISLMELSMEQGNFYTKKTSFLFFIFILNTFLVMGLYALYIYFSFFTFNVYETIILQVTVAFAKIAWNYFVSISISRFISYQFFGWTAHLISCILILNDIILFFFVCLINEPLCVFYAAFPKYISTVSSSYEIATCADFIVTGLNYECVEIYNQTFDINFTPPFIYRYFIIF